MDLRRLTEGYEAKHRWLAAAATMGLVLAVAFGGIAVAAFANARDPASLFTWLKTTPPPRAPKPVAFEDPTFRGPDIRLAAVERGDTLAQILIEAGAEPEDATAAVAALGAVFDVSDLRAGQTVTLTFAPEGAPLTGVAFRPSVERDVAVTRSADGTFAAEENVKLLSAMDARASGVIDGSLYLSAKAAGVPEAVIVDLIRIYSYDVDFQREVRSGDRFDLLYTHYVDETGETIKGGAIQYAALTLRGQAKPLYRFTAGDRATDYFTPKGWSGKRQLMRTPIDGARLTSRYGVRRHPILGYTKMHKGVDFGAPKGTPVMAAGAGMIEKAAWFGGYGRYVRVKHANSYATAYAHLSRFARGVKPGARVRQGQVIGYVGSSGRSTGPHLHYEVLAKARQINPMGVKIPTGRNLAGADLAAFKAEVARVGQVLLAMPTAPSVVAQRESAVAATAAP